MAGEHARHPGGGFNPPEPTTRGGPDYGRFIEAVRALQDHARAVDAPDAVISEAADLIEKVSDLLSPFDADEWTTPSGRRMDLPNRGNILPVPMKVRRTGKTPAGSRVGPVSAGSIWAATGPCMAARSGCCSTRFWV